MGAPASLAIGGACRGMSTGGCNRGRPRNVPTTRPRFPPAKLTEPSSRMGGAFASSGFLRNMRLRVGTGESTSNPPCTDDESELSRNARCQKVSPMTAGLALADEPPPRARMVLLPPSCKLMGTAPMVLRPLALGLVPEPKEEKGSDTANVRGLSAVRVSAEGVPSDIIPTSVVFVSDCACKPMPRDEHACEGLTHSRRSKKATASRVSRGTAAAGPCAVGMVVRGGGGPTSDRSKGVDLSKSVGPARLLRSLRASLSRNSAAVTTSSSFSLRGSCATVEGDCTIMDSTSESIVHALSRLPLLAAKAARCSASATSTRLRSRSSGIGGGDTPLDSATPWPACQCSHAHTASGWVDVAAAAQRFAGSGVRQGGRRLTTGLDTPAQSSKLLVSIFTASKYCSEKRTTSIAGSAEARAGSQTSTGTWHASPAWRSPIDTS